jgi:hypothetical protein
MSYRIERSIDIATPAQFLWDVVQDVSRRIEWDARVITCEIVTDGPFGKGSQALIGYNLFGARMEVVMEMVAWAPPRKSAARALPNPMGSLAGSWHFVEHPDGSTTFTTKIVIRCETGILRGLRQHVLGWYLDRLTARSQAQLKTLVEAEYAAGAHGSAVPVAAIATAVASPDSRISRSPEISAALHR